jgi:hypothetical protein
MLIPTKSYLAQLDAISDPREKYKSKYGTINIRRYSKSSFIVQFLSS